jgi:hypothetical protein
MDVPHWLADMQRYYGQLQDMDTESSMSDREFTCAVIDNLPQDATWRIFATSLQACISKYDDRTPPTPVNSRHFFTSIRNEAWFRSKEELQAAAHIFSARTDADKKMSKHMHLSETVTPNAKHPHTTNDKSCTNLHCSHKGHDISECVMYGGGSQGQYAPWWKGPWNLHLPPDQRSHANNVLPTSHSAYARLTTATHAAACFIPSTADSTAVPIATTTLSTTDSNAHINSVVACELPSFNTRLDDEIIVATLPVLRDGALNADQCHYDSSANRHVFKDQTTFETYHHIQPVMVKGFGDDLSTLAIGRGTVRLQGLRNNRLMTILLTHALHIPATCSNLISGIQLDKVGVTAILGGGTATLSLQGQKVIEGAIHNDMFRLNISIVRPVAQQSLLSCIDNPPLISHIGPLVAAVNSDRAGFCIA